MRDLAVLAAMLVMIPLALRNPFAAFILWGWTTAITLSYYLYGFMVPVRYNLIFALITLALIGLGRLKWRENWQPSLTLILTVWFCIHVSISAALAYSPNPFNAEYYFNFVKSMFFCLLIPVVLTTRMRFHAFVIMLAMGLGFHGLLDGLKFIASGGGHRTHGLPASMLSDNNHFAVGLAIALPILYYLYQYSQNRLARLGFIGCFTLIILAILATHSRGGFLCMAVVGIWMVITSRRKILISSLALVGILLVLNLAPADWFDRIQTIQSANQDSSFMGRVLVWKISSAIALAHPVFGGGFHAVQSVPVWETFKFSQGLLGFVNTPEPGLIPRAAHSIYFEVLGDHGFLGLLLFLGIMASTLLNCLKIRSMVGKRSDLLWARDLSDLLGVAVVAYAVGGAAVSLGYFEIYYMVVMAILALRHYVVRQTNLIPDEKST